MNYHLAAGVEHFYLYDDGSTDNPREVLEPYIEAELADYFPVAGENMTIPVYNDAVRRFKFAARYMAFIDLDEFLYPKSNRSVVEVVDEILSHDLKAAGLGIHWQIFGSNGHETADYTRGVLERFTRRAPKNWYLPPGYEGNHFAQGNCYIKNIVNPRRIKFFHDPHTMNYFAGFYTVDENLTPVAISMPVPVAADKIVVNHYAIKSREEYKKKMPRGFACSDENPYDKKYFETHDRNEVFDDGILNYRAARAEDVSLETDAAKVRRVTNALTATLTKYANDELSDLETALVCRAASNFLGLKVHEEASLAAVLKSLDGTTIADAQLLIRELPKLLRLPYPAVNELRSVALQIIQKLMDFMRVNKLWEDYVELDYIGDLLEE